MAERLAISTPIAVLSSSDTTGDRSSRKTVISINTFSPAPSTPCSSLKSSSLICTPPLRTITSTRRRLSCSSSSSGVSAVTFSSSDPLQLKSARDDIKELLDSTFCHPILVRLGWHDAGTYDKNVEEWPKRGGANGSLRFEIELKHAANAGLVNALKLIQPIKDKYPGITYADLFQLASATAIEEAGGPKIPMRYGRVDVSGPEQCPIRSFTSSPSKLGWQVLSLFFSEITRSYHMMELLSLSCSSHTSPMDFQRESGLFQKRIISRNPLATSIRCSSSGVAGKDPAGIGLITTTSDAPVLPKLLIPGLPPEGNKTAPPITSCFWEWKPKLNVHYEKAGMENMESPPLLFLPGFGVGSFHYEKQLNDLGRDYRVWALDFLGQGKSLPSEDPTTASDHDQWLWGYGEQTEPWAEELVYSVDLWRDQVQNFVENVIGEPVYIVGNSLGGFVALYLAAFNPDLVKGVILLNATPFWGLLPNPTRSPKLAKLFPWAGTFPLPARVRWFTEILWQKMSDPESIHHILKQVYADHSTKVDQLFNHIIKATQHPAAPASFASIMCAPRAKMSFDESLIRCKLQGLPICLMYGKDDPWVNTFWGLQVKRQLPEAPYYQISPAGHCPHDEVPEVVNYLLRAWIKNIESQGKFSLPLVQDSEALANDVSTDFEFVREGSRRLVRVQFCGTDLSIWDRIALFFKSYVTN